MMTRTAKIAVYAAAMNMTLQIVTTFGLAGILLSSVKSILPTSWPKLSQMMTKLTFLST